MIREISDKQIGNAIARLQVTDEVIGINLLEVAMAFLKDPHIGDVNVFRKAIIRLVDEIDERHRKQMLLDEFDKLMKSDSVSHA